MNKVPLVLALTAMLAGCASGPPRPSKAQVRQIEQMLSTAPGEAQPSRVVAAESAFELAAVKDGQWTAFRAFAAPGAVLHTESGATDAAAWLSGRSDPEASVRWNVRAVWLSCDGRLALSRGRLKTPGGMVGTFVTVWERQRDGEYRWIYDTGAPDDPQPAPAREDEPSEDLIVVGALETVQGHVADCVRGPDAVKPEPVSLPDGAAAAGGLSPDRTLQWKAIDNGDGTRRVVANILEDGQWRPAMDQAIPGPIVPLNK